MAFTSFRAREAGATKIKMGNFYFTAYQETEKIMKGLTVHEMTKNYEAQKGEKATEPERQAIKYIHSVTKDMPPPILSDNLKALEDNPKFSEKTKIFVKYLKI